MSTCTSVLTSEEADRISAILDSTIYCPGDPPPSLKGYALYLFNQGEMGSKLRAKAARIQECCQFFRKHKDAVGHVWTITYSCMCRTCPTCAEVFAERDRVKYSLLEPLCPGEFLYLEVNDFAAAKVRRALGKLKMPLLSKVGWKSGYPVAKMMLLALPTSIPSKTLNKIRQLDMEIKITTCDRSQFAEILDRVTKADLPIAYDDLLSIEQGKRRVHFQGVSQARRKELFVQVEKDITNNFTENSLEDLSSPMARPLSVCPKCGLPSISHTQKLHLGASLKEERWTRPEVASSPPS